MFCAHGIPQWGGDRVSRVASSSWNALVFFQPLSNELLSTKADNGALTSPLLPLPLLLPLRPFLPPPPLQCSPWTLSANSAALFFFSAASSSSSALFFISAANSPFVSAAFRATSSIAASTPLSISPSSPASSSALAFLSSSGSSPISAARKESSARSLRLKSLLQHLLHCRCASFQLCVNRLRLSPSLRLLKSPRR